MESTQVKNNVSFLVFCSRVGSIFTRSRNNKPKRVLEISAPFDLKLGPVSLPGVSQDELAILRDRAAASRVGTIEAIPSSSSSMSSWDSRPTVTSNPAHVGATSRAVW